MNYEETAKNNLNQFFSDELTEERELLLDVARRFNNKCLNWCLIGSSTLFFRGITTDFTGYDILIDYTDITEAIEIVKELHAMDMPKGDLTLDASTLFNKYKIGNIHLNLFSEIRLRTVVEFEYKFHPLYIDKINISYMEIPIISAPIQHTLYSVSGLLQIPCRDEADLLSAYLKKIER